MLRDILVRKYDNDRKSDFEILSDMFAAAAIMTVISYLTLLALILCKVLPLFLVLKTLGISMVVGYIVSSWSGFKDETERKYAIVLGTVLVPGFLAANIIAFIIIPLIKLIGKTILAGGFMKLHLALSYIPKLFMTRIATKNKV